MKKLIVKEGNRTGLIHIKEKTKFSGEIIWDELKDGPIPANMEGKERWAKRGGTAQNPTLSEDSAMKTQVLADDQVMSDNQGVINQRLLDLKNYDGNTSESGAMLVKLLEHLNMR